MSQVRNSFWKGPEFLDIIKPDCTEVPESQEIENVNAIYVYSLTVPGWDCVH